jgi:hypothetical protein
MYEKKFGTAPNERLPERGVELVQSLDPAELAAVSQELEALPEGISGTKRELLEEKLLSVLGPLILLLGRETSFAATGKTMLANAAEAVGVLDSLGKGADHVRPLLGAVASYIRKPANSGFILKFRELHEGLKLRSW